MNKISFKGSNAIIKDIVARFLAGDDGPIVPTDAERRWLETAAGKIDAAGAVDRQCLGFLLDYLVTHGWTKAKLDWMITERSDELVRLARDVGCLRRYMRDGTITDVRIVDEWPF